MNVLHQRIRLLSKQWEELKSQAGLREHRLQDSTFRWSNLGEQMRALMDWMDDMEMKIVSSREVHVEDLLNKLETVSSKRRMPGTCLFTLSPPRIHD